VTTFEELDRLGSKELHDRALHHARHHLDVGFYWKLVEAIPGAEAAAGHEDRERTDVESGWSLLLDTFKADDGSLADALRPLYIEYLLEHDH
jgi:hypothetical protein